MHLQFDVLFVDKTSGYITRIKEIWKCLALLVSYATAYRIVVEIDLSSDNIITIEFPRLTFYLSRHKFTRFLYGDNSQT
jgi:hypothetical protein